jgi:hypothetical protein
MIFNDFHSVRYALIISKDNEIDSVRRVSQIKGVHFISIFNFSV